MRITLIGSGNVATVMGRRIYQNAHMIQQVYSRDIAHATLLAEELSAEAVASFADIDDSADIYIVALSDQALQELPGDFNGKQKLVVHTAGSVAMDVLSHVSENYGVLYPLQTLRKELPYSPYLPMLVDASNPWNKTRLAAFAQSFADKVDYADDLTRSKLHLAAVISNNFSNYLFGLAQEYCEKEGMDFSSIFPLLEETVKRLNYAPAASLQTGPAIRGDDITINRHLEMLAEHRGLRELYEWFSGKIAR